jgi:hypothetical protein
LRADARSGAERRVRDRRAGSFGNGLDQAARSQVLINGKRLPITPFSGPDRYNPITASKVRTVAKWKGSLTGTGYQIQISTTEPTVKIWKTCKTGTSCVVPKAVPILNGEEMSWTVRMMVKKPHLVKVIAGFTVCLARHAHPA